MHDTLVVTDKHQRPMEALCGMLSDGAAFIVGGGPSANAIDLEKLNERGTWSIAVNNMAAHPRFRPQAFVCSDPPSKFHNAIWLDPGIMKFVPVPKLRKRRGRLRKKVGDEFVNLERGGEWMSTCDCPNVWGFSRRAWLKPDDTFFSEDSAAWGNHNAGVKMTGLPKTVCTTLLALRLLHYLGAKTIFLVGVDFFMKSNNSLHGNYAFNEDRDQEAINSNNEQFRNVNSWMCEMAENGTFDRAGLSIYNCCETSGLRAFPYVSFDDAFDYVTEDIDQSLDLRDWYKK